MKGPEYFEKRDIDFYLASIGAYNCKPASGGYGASGTPDRLVCIRRSPAASEGTFWGIEVKRPGKGPTRLQETRIAEIRAAGGQATWGTAAKVIAEIESWRGGSTS